MYSTLVASLTNAYHIAERLGIEDQALSKSLSDIILANYLGHSISGGGRGGDAYDDEFEYEYKCTSTDVQAIFNLGLGSNYTEEEKIEAFRDKFDGIEGVYYAKMTWGEIDEVVYCEMTELMPILIQKIRDSDADMPAPQISWKDFNAIEETVSVQISEEFPYRDLVALLLAAFQQAKELELSQELFSKGAHNHLFLAQREGHQLPQHGGGKDAYDRDGDYEYKITKAADWNFNFGVRKTREENRRLISEKCQNLSAAYLAQRQFAELIRVIRIPANELEQFLLDKEASTTSGQMNLRISRPDLRDYVMHPNPDYAWMGLDGLKRIALERGIKVARLGWPKACPPRGNMLDIISRLKIYDREHR